MKPDFLARACLAAAAFSPAMQAGAAPVELTGPGMPAHIAQLSQGPGGTLCIVGQVPGAQGASRKRGLVILFDMAKNAVRWQRMVDAPGNDAQTAFVACHTDGRTVLVGADVEVHGRVVAHAWRFDENGDPAAPVPLVGTSGDAHVLAIDADAGGVTVAGMTRAASEGRQSSALFFARLDPALRGAAVDRLPTGAYLPGSAAKLAGNTLYLGGNFAPATATAQAVPDDYAVSKIVGGKYRFSLRPHTLPAADVASAISFDNDIVSLGHAGTTTTLAAVDANGRAKDRLQFRSTFCTTGSMGADAGTVYAVRWLCGNAREPAVLVAIDRKTGAELIVSGIVGEPVAVQLAGTQVVVVARKSNGSLLLQAVDKGQEPD